MLRRGLLVCGVLSSPAVCRNDYLRCEAVGRRQLHLTNHQRVVGYWRSHEIPVGGAGRHVNTGTRDRLRLGRLEIGHSRIAPCAPWEA